MVASILGKITANLRFSHEEGFENDRIGKRTGFCGGGGGGGVGGHGNRCHGGSDDETDDAADHATGDLAGIAAGPATGDPAGNATAAAARWRRGRPRVISWPCYGFGARLHALWRLFLWR